MTFDIPSVKWTEFLNDFSKRRFGWEAKIEIISSEIGDQVLAAGLPLAGIAFQDRHGKTEIEILVGDSSAHQTHTIASPTALRYMNEESGYRGLLEIEEASGAKTLVMLLDPMPVHIGYAAFKIVAAS